MGSTFYWNNSWHLLKITAVLIYSGHLFAR